MDTLLARMFKREDGQDPGKPGTPMSRAPANSQRNLKPIIDVEHWARTCECATEAAHPEPGPSINPHLNPERSAYASPYA